MRGNEISSLSDGYLHGTEKSAKRCASSLVSFVGTDLISSKSQHTSHVKHIEPVVEARKSIERLPIHRKHAGETDIEPLPTDPRLPISSRINAGESAVVNI